MFVSYMQTMNSFNKSTHKQLNIYSAISRKVEMICSFIVFANVLKKVSRIKILPYLILKDALT